MSKEEQIDLIAGRIIDEYRKHPLLEWNKIAASKIHSQWFQHYTDEINDLKSQLLISEQKVKLNYVNLVDAINENEQLKESISDLKFQLKAASRFRTL